MNNKPYYESIHEIIKTGHKITDGINKRLKQSGSTEPQYNVLRILFITINEPITIDKIQEGMVQANSNVTRIIDKLHIKGYVTREECKTNRRKKDIMLTTKGIEYLNTLEKIVEEYHKPMMTKLDIAELSKLKELISKLNI